MNSQALTLFGEEPAPEQLNAVGKSRAKKKAANKPGPKDTSAARPKKIGKTSAVLDGWQPEKNYYSIGEVATLFQVNTSHIRFWTKEFSLKVRTTKKGDRLYTPDQVLELRNIYHLVKERGFTLSGAKAKLKGEKKNISETIDLKQSLLKLRNQLVAIRNQVG